MITGDYSRYQINITQFDNLFTDNVNIQTVDALSESAAAGNLDCIDLLHNLALRHDEAGKRAENTLFDLFSGKKKGVAGVDEDIQLASLKLYQTATDTKEKNNEDMRKFDIPSKLLYMAGSAVTQIAQKHDLSTIFRERQIAQSELEQFDDIDLWDSNRMLMTDEINTAMNNVIRNADNFSLNFPIGLIKPIDDSNMLSEQIVEKIASTSLFHKPDIFPINIDEHWMLFVLYSDELGHRKSVVFNSLDELNADIKDQLMSSAKIAGVAEEDIEFINGDMQKNMPNGCGIFVIKAMELLSDTREEKITETLKSFTRDFSNLSIEEQILFNIQNRRQIYGYSIP